MTPMYPRDSMLSTPIGIVLISCRYRYQMTPAIDVSPDIQWIRGALGGLTDGGDATVLGCRLNMTL